MLAGGAFTSVASCGAISDGIGPDLAPGTAENCWDLARFRLFALTAGAAFGTVKFRRALNRALGMAQPGERPRRRRRSWRCDSVAITTERSGLITKKRL